jgi:hypothetical protein
MMVEPLRAVQNGHRAARHITEAGSGSGGIREIPSCFLGAALEFAREIVAGKFTAGGRLPQPLEPSPLAAIGWELVNNRTSANRPVGA